MKQLLVPVLAAAIAASAAFAYVSSRKNAEHQRTLLDQRALWDAERDRLEEELARARRQPQFVRTVSAPGEPVVMAASPGPEEIIEKLRASSRDPKSIRRVIHHLEQLVDLGPAALPAIENYLGKFEDVSYSAAAQEEAGDEGRRGRGGPPNWRGGRGSARLSFTTPPSLRFGLVDVLASIGGGESERILADVLGGTGRPAELAYVAKTLNEMKPNAHRDMAVTAAKDLLMNPPALPGGDRMDENSKDYLYYVLNLFGDASFAAVAQDLLITPEGRIDRQALGYLNNALKDQAMPAIHSAFFDARLTNQMERASLMAMAMSYAGQNQQANEMIHAVVSDESVRPELRALAVFGLTRGEPSPEMIQARLPLVEALKGSTSDERVQRTLDVTHQNLQKMLAGEPVENNPWRAMRAGGSERGFRGRGARGQ